MLLWIEWSATFPENVWEYIDIDLLPPFQFDETRYQITLFFGVDELSDENMKILSK